MPENITIGFISWGAVLAGVVCILAFQMIFAMLGLSIGLRIAPHTDEPQKLQIGGAIYSVITSLLSVYFGAWIAGRLAGDISAFDSMLHGVIAWGLSVLITDLIIARGTGMMLSGTIGAVKSVLNTISGGIQQTMQAAAPGIQQMTQTMGSRYQEGGSMREQWDQMHRDIENLLRESGKPELQPENNIENTVRKVFTQGKGSVDRQAIVNVLEKETRMNHQQAEATADKWITTYQRASEKVQYVKDEAAARSKEAAEKSAVILSHLAFLSFVMLVLTLGISMLGAYHGAIA